MARNNKNTYIYKTQQDSIRRANERRKSIDKYDSDKINLVKEDIANIFQEMFKGKEVIINSNVSTISNPSKTFDAKQPTKTYEYSQVTEAIKKLYDNNFYDVVSGKISTAEQLMMKSIENNVKLQMVNQAGKSNESLYSFTEKIKYMRELKKPENNGTFIVYDLETLGGKDAHGVWRPTHITEFSMHQYDSKGNGIDGKKIDILMGWRDKDEAEHLFKRIKTAIKDGTIDYDEELRVAAHRLSLYGHDKVTSVFDKDLGVYKTASFIDSKYGDHKDIDRIKKGIDFFLDIGKKTGVDEHGVPLDVKLMMQTVANANTLLNDNSKYAMLVDYNGSMFDKPIIDSFGNKFIAQHPSLKNLFDNGEFSLNASGHKHIDVQGALQHFRNNFSTKALLGDKVHEIDEARLNRQEHYVKAFYSKLFKDNGLKPHEASSDVTALGYFLTQEAEGLGMPLIDYIAEKLDPIANSKKVHNLEAGQQILKAKGYYNGTYGGKNMLNFAIDNRTNSIFTADNHMIRNGQILKQDFNVGVGLNQGAYYQLGGVREIKAGNPYLKIMSDIFPQYSSSNMYAVTLNMMTTEDFKDSRLGALSQVVLFNSETELQAFMSNTFDVVAEKVDGEFKVLNRDAFDIREYDMINGKPIFKDVNKNYAKSDSKLINDAIEFSNRKITTSRAENAINGDNAYNNIRKALEIQNIAKDHLGRYINDRELNGIMSRNISEGKMALSIQEELANKITKVLEHKNGVYDSTIDNMSTYMNTIKDSSAYYTKLFEALNNNEKFTSQKSATVQKEMFKRVDRHLREFLATNIYEDFSRQKKSVLGDEALQAPIERFKSMFEVDLAGMPGAKKQQYFDLVKAKESGLLRLDLDKNNVEYSLVSAVNTMLQGDKKIRPEDEFALTNKNFRKFVDYMLQDKTFKKSIGEDFRNELFNIVNNDMEYNHIDVAGRMISEFRNIKKANPFAGIKSKDLYMKDLTSTSGFTNALNGEKFLNTVDDLVNTHLKDMDIRLINGNRNAAEMFVKDNILDFYVPKNPTNIVQTKARQEMNNYLTELVYTADKIGAGISVNDYGDITLNSNGKITTLNLPKIKADGDSDIWYIQTGNMKNKLMGKLNINPTLGGKSVDMSVSTNFGAAIGSFPMSKTVEDFYNKNISGKATKESMDYIETIVNTGKKKLIKNSTINGFNGNDLNSNRLMDVSSISNVLQELFGENGKLNYLVKNKNFLDSNLQEVLGKDVARYIKSGKPIEELDANMTKDLIKNMPHLLEILGVKANVQGTEVEEVLKQLSFTGNVKQSSSMIGVLGDMPLFSPHAALSNLQRPPILAAGNAIPLRTDAVRKLEGSGVLAGNIISTASTDKATMRYVAGVGETTTDVMMNIAYVSTDALDVIRTNNIDRVLATKADVDSNYKARMNSMFAKLNTYEQERHMDGRIAEKLYGLMPSKVQNISASKDIASAIELMTEQEAKAQADLLIGLRGSVTIDKSGQLSYKSATGKYVKRGDAIVQTLGFGDKLEAISPKVQQGVFTHKFMKSNGMALTDEEITKIINQNKSVFMENGKLVSNTNATIKLSNLLESKYEATGLYRIQDISAAGYIKPTTSSAEKGMTNLNYIKTGTLDKNVDNFFKSIGMQDVSRQSVLYDESIDAILGHVGKNKVKSGLKASGFKTVDALKQAINKERNMFNEFLMDDLFGGKAHMFVNDGVFKHGGSGQVQFGILNKAIDNYIKANNGDVEDTLKKVVDIINSNKEFQFLSTKNLNTNKSQYTKFRMKDGRIHMDDMATNIENLTVSNIESLEKLIIQIDNNIKDLGGDRVVHREGYVQKWNKETKEMEIVPIGDKPLFGDWMTQEIDGKKVFVTPITKEDVKLLPDVETQTGTESEYFKLKDHLMSLKSRKNSTNDQLKKQKLMEEINIVEAQLKNYESVSKRMTVGSTEFQLLERIRVTDQHAQHMQDLIAKGELTDEILASEALKGKIIRNSKGQLEVDKKLKEPVLDHWLQRFKGQLTYNPLEELKLTAKDVAEGSPMEHLSGVFERANKYGYDIGQDSAQKLYQLEMADYAVRFNQDGKITTDKMKDLGFEVKKLDEINFEVDEIAKKNLLIDLGPEFEGNRFIAVAGTGHQLGDDDEILTNGQKQLRALAHRYDEYKDNRHAPEEQRKIKERMINQIDETKTAIKESIYGKNAYADTLNKIQVDDVNYRYKASGAVTSEFTPGLNKALKNSSSNLEINNDLLSTRFINNKSLSEWHKEGVHYDYKFVSLEAMQDMGMFNEDTMKAYGAKDRADMIEKLKKYGTMDITDRYPNNKNDSILMTHVFLDTDYLVGNQTKVAGVSGLKMLLDHDGDSVSSFALRYKAADGTMLDYGMFLNNPEMVKEKSQEAYDTFASMLATTTIRAATENKKWAEDVNDILVKDAIKNTEMGDLTKTALVPDGQSIFGKITPAGLSHMDTIEGTEENRKQINTLLTKAKDFLNTNEVKGIEASDLDLGSAKSEIVLDKALTVMQEAKKQGIINKDELSSFESSAIKKVAIDRLALQNSANTGVATTGAINVATNSIKRAAHDTLINQDAMSVDMIRSILDIPEQEAISSKKIVSAYDDTRGREMSEILNDMFNPQKNRKSTAIDQENMTDLRNWFKTHAKDKIEAVYDEFAPRMDKEVQEHIAANPGQKFNYIMDQFTNQLDSLSRNEYFQAKRMNYKSRGYTGVGAGYSDDSYSAIVGKMIGKADDSFKIRADEQQQIVEEAIKRQKNANAFYANTQTTKQVSNAVSNMVDSLSSSSFKMGGSLAMGALGLAGGLMAAGYASGNPLNDKQASQVAQEGQQPTQTMSIPDFMDKQGGFVTGNSQQGYIINIKADTKKGRKHMQRIMKQAAEASVGGAVSVNMNIRNSEERGITDADIENFLERYF